MQQPESQTDHIALLAIMLCGTLIKRLHELEQLDEATVRRLHILVTSVRKHAKNHGLTDLDLLFDNIDLALGGGGSAA